MHRNNLFSNDGTVGKEQGPPPHVNNTNEPTSKAYLLPGSQGPKTDEERHFVTLDFNQ